MFAEEPVNDATTNAHAPDWLPIEREETSRLVRADRSFKRDTCGATTKKNLLRPCAYDNFLYQAS